MLCPDVVGRDREVDRLHGRLDSLVEAGDGGVVVLVGEAGTGKSRLLSVAVEAAQARGGRVLTGRAVPGESLSPYRPLRDALLREFRTEPVPVHASLAGFEGHLARLLPSSSPAAVENSAMLVGEALVRLLAVVAHDTPVIMVLEDLHWADPETVAVLDHLADALVGQQILCLCSARPLGAVDELVSRLRRRDVTSVIDLWPLAVADTEAMVRSCLAGAEPPTGLCELVVGHADGIPYLVEELLAGLVAAGQLRHDGASWHTAGPLRPWVPASLRASIGQRLTALAPPERRIVAAAAVLGRHFDWELLPAIAEVDAPSAAAALRAGVAAQLIDVHGDDFAFRHALTREAVLADLLPPERRAFAKKAWHALEAADPGLPGSLCQLAADLAEAAGEPASAAGLLVESARRSFDDAALVTAEVTARRAIDLAQGIDEDVVTGGREVLMHVLVAAGKPTEAIEIAQALLARFELSGASDDRWLEILVATARAALVAGDLDAAAAAVDRGRRILEDGADADARARLDAVAGEVALDRGELSEAEQLTRRAIDVARATGQPAVRCEALMVLGRIIRSRDSAAAREVFADAVDAAIQAGPRWHLRARQEHAISAWVGSGATPLVETRDLAVSYGAHLTAAVMDLSLADMALTTFDAPGCLRHAEACVDASRRFGLATEPVGHLWLAGAHALGGDDAAMERSLENSLACDRDDPRILGDLYGRVLVTRAFVQDDLDALGPLTESMMEHVRRAPPTTSVFPGRILWALLATIDGDDLGVAARTEFSEVVERYDFPMFVESARLMDAVALGRQGEAEAAHALLMPSFETLDASAISRGGFHALMMLVAQAAIRDGWGDPARWLRTVEAFFTEHGFDRPARRCRRLLVEAGAPVPRRRGSTVVPEGLRALGVTGREVDVLRQLMAGGTNKEIAAALVLSPKTVERHLSNLFGRLGVNDRRELAAVGEVYLHDER